MKKPMKKPMKKSAKKPVKKGSIIRHTKTHRQFPAWMISDVDLDRFDAYSKLDPTLQTVTLPRDLVETALSSLVWARNTLQQDHNYATYSQPLSLFLPKGLKQILADRTTKPSWKEAFQFRKLRGTTVESDPANTRGRE